MRRCAATCPLRAAPSRGLLVEQHVGALRQHRREADGRHRGVVEVQPAAVGLLHVRRVVAAWWGRGAGRGAERAGRVRFESGVMAGQMGCGRLVGRWVGAG